jgi:hypothetical protein
MRIPKSGSFYFAFFLLLLISLLVVIATQYNKNAALMPLVVGIPTVLLIIVEMLREQNPVFAKFLETDVFHSKKAKPAGDKGPIEPKQKTIKELKAILIIIGFMLLVLMTGFLVAIPVFSFVYIFIFARESWNKALMAAISTWLFIYAIFCALMDIKFPWSFLF